MFAKKKTEPQPQPRRESLADKAIRMARVQIQQSCHEAEQSASRLIEKAANYTQPKLVKVTK